jgi:hypothetical protein
MPARAPLAVLALALIAASGPDPLAGYYGNTLVALGPAGDDQGHLWLDPGGFIQFGGAHPTRTGAITVTPLAAAARVCLTPAPSTLVVPPPFTAQPTPDRFADCLTLSPRQPNERWQTPDHQRWLLLPGQQ